MSLVCKWNECYEEYVNEKELFDHLEEHLSKIKFPKTQPCQWENCKFVTPTRFRLKTHLKSHVPYKNYECRFCSHASKHKSGLNRHLLLHHSQNSKGFKRNDSKNENTKFKSEESPLLQSSVLKTTVYVEDIFTEIPTKKHRHEKLDSIETLSLIARLFLS